MEPQLEEAIGRISKEVIVAVNGHVTEVVTAAERRAVTLEKSERDYSPSPLFG